MINNVHYTEILQINSTYCQIVPIFESLALFGTISYIAKWTKWLGGMRSEGVTTLFFFLSCSRLEATVHYGFLPQSWYYKKGRAVAGCSKYLCNAMAT